MIGLSVLDSAGFAYLGTSGGDPPVSSSLGSSNHDHQAIHTTSVTIRVTPYDDFYLSWAILWGLYFVFVCVAAWQVLKERKALTRLHPADVVDPAASTAVLESETTFSSADRTRCVFRRLLLLAMLFRLVLFPLQIWTSELWFQFFADSFPGMLFATAWSLLLSFVMQVVGIATGSGTTDTTPLMVIQATAFVFYFALVVIQFSNSIAPVFIYAFLCVIYAALTGIVLYFGPRLLSLLRQTLEWKSVLSFRILLTTILCVVVFSAHTVVYARRIFSPPVKIYWWWHYGCLELFPAVVFLATLTPTVRKVTRLEQEQVTSSPDDFASSVGEQAENGAVKLTPGRRYNENTALLKAAFQQNS